MDVALFDLLCFASGSSYSFIPITDVVFLLFLVQNVASEPCRAFDAFSTI